MEGSGHEVRHTVLLCLSPFVGVLPCYSSCHDGVIVVGTMGALSFRCLVVTVEL